MQTTLLRAPLSMRLSLQTAITASALVLSLFAQTSPAQPSDAPYNDHQNMMDQLGIKALRPGKNGQNQTGPGFDEATANPYASSMPEVLTMKDGTKVTRPDQWPARRAEIQEDFEREVYGRIPANTPKVTWEVTNTVYGTNAGVRTITRNLLGHVDNSADPDITVNIQANFTVAANVTQPVPIMIEFGFGSFNFGGRRPGGTNGPGTNAFARGPGGTNGSGTNALARGGFGGRGEPGWHSQALSNGWAYGTIVPTSIQEDNNHLRSGIIGLCNKGQPRKPDDWGALRAWQWGVSRMIDYFEAHPEYMVDAKKVGIEGLSRYGKAALVTEAFDTRVAVGLIGSSGEGGAKLSRHDFGESVENLTGSGEYHWMAGNFLKYGASDPKKTAADLPVDSHELIAMCAPRPCFISYGIPEKGDAKWVDAHGSFMAAVLAGPVYRLLGKKDLGTPGNYLTDPMPPTLTLIGGDLAWRQHEGGHDVTPNWPSFFEWVKGYVKAPRQPPTSVTVKATN
ncbi:MAG TPA: acetylxylan esterase [Verrucomicrobiae bacterium]|nr:acetylxylan esterase [Verrucomicrobiae bacterium]